MDFLHAIFYYSLVRLISGIYSSLMMSVPQSTQLGILTITPLASCLLIVRSGRLASTLPYMLGETQSGKFGIPIKPIALFTLVSFFNTFARKPIPAADRAFAVFGVVFVVGLFLIFALRYFSRLTFSSLYKISVPLFAAGALCSIMSGSYLIPGAFITNGAYALFSVFVTALLSAFSYRYGVSSLWLFGLSEAAILYGNTLADSFYDIISVGILYNWTYKLILSILLLIYISVSLFVIPSREEDEAWGVWTSAGKRSGETTISSLTLQEKIQYVSRRYGLTKREEEVLLDMYKGKTLSEIAQCMCIAPSTMKTHTRHIYRKTGVSNRQELTDLLDSLDSRKTPQRTGSVHQ